MEYTLNDAAQLLGTTKGAINAHRRRKEWALDEMYKVDDGTVMVTQAGMDKLASMVRTTQAEEYIQARAAEGTAIVLSEEIIELEVYPHIPVNAPDPQQVGQGIAQAKYLQDIQQYVDDINAAAESEYEQLWSGGTQQVGKSLAQRWGLTLDTVMENLTL